LNGDALDAHTRAWAEAVNHSGDGYLTPAMVDGRWLVRISIGAPTTERDDVEAIWAPSSDTPKQPWKHAGLRPAGNSIRDDLETAGCVRVSPKSILSQALLNQLVPTGARPHHSVANYPTRTWHGVNERDPE
jgi:hypothetical protein